MSALLNESIKPRTVFCRRSELIAWTGWSAKLIAYFVAEGKLKQWLPPAVRGKSAHPRYSVRGVQELIDEIESRNGAQ